MEKRGPISLLHKIISMTVYKCTDIYDLKIKTIVNIYQVPSICQAFHDSSVGKESTCNAGDEV